MQLFSLFDRLFSSCYELAEESDCVQPSCSVDLPKKVSKKRGHKNLGNEKNLKKQKSSDEKQKPAEKTTTTRKRSRAKESTDAKQPPQKRRKRIKIINTNDVARVTRSTIKFSSSTHENSQKSDIQVQPIDNDCDDGFDFVSNVADELQNYSTPPTNLSSDIGDTDNERESTGGHGKKDDIDSQDEIEQQNRDIHASEEIARKTEAVPRFAGFEANDMAKSRSTLEQLSMKRGLLLF